MYVCMFFDVVVVVGGGGCVGIYYGCLASSFALHRLGRFDKCVYLCVYMSMRIHTCTYVCIYARMYVYMHVCMYVCMQKYPICVQDILSILAWKTDEKKWYMDR